MGTTSFYRRFCGIFCLYQFKLRSLEMQHEDAPFRFLGLQIDSDPVANDGDGFDALWCQYDMPRARDYCHD